MAWRGLEGEELIQNLKQLVISFEPHIKEAGSVEQAEEALLHLEENDENFHRYEFVKQLKRKIEEVLGPLIEDEIEKHATAGHTIGQDTLVSKITDKLIQSRNYNDMSRKMRKVITEAVEELLKNFDAEFGTGRHRDANDKLLHRHQHRVYNVSDEEESSCDSSFNQGIFSFNNHEVLQQVAEKLNKNRDIQSRREAMQSLNQNLPADFINSDYWHSIRRSLLDILADPDEFLTVLSQKFITRAFTTTSQQTREIYTLLVEYLITQFQSRRGMIPKVKNGLDVTKVDIIKLLKAFRLLNEFQQETTNYWIRYPERYLDEILESTLNLFCIHEPGGQIGMPAQLTPIHFIALIDPKAQWFIKWMHGNYSRMRLLKLLEKYRPIVENAVRHCLEFSAHRKLPFDIMSDISDTLSKTSMTGGKRTFYAGAELEYAYFIHSVYVLGRILCFVNGRKFFPIKLRDSDEPVSITKLLVAFVLVVVDPSASFIPPRSPSLAYEPANVVTDVLKVICSSEQACEICLYKDEITSTLLSPVSQFLDTSDHHPPSEKTLLHVADIVSMIASSTKGRRHLMYGEKKDLFTRTKSSAAHIIAKFTKKALLGELPREAGPGPSHAVIGAYLYICRQLYNTCEGLLVLYPYDLHTVVAEAWREAYREVEAAVTPTPEDDSSSDSCSNINTHRGSYDIHAWEDTLRDNLLNFASTAKGILLLQQTGAMNECMYYMHARYEKKLQVSKCEKFGYGYMVTQVAATAPGMVALQKTGYISSLMAEIWTVLECGSSDVPLLTPKVYPVDPIDRMSHKHLLRLLNILSAFSAVYEMLSVKRMITKKEYSFREMPETIAGFIDRLVLVNTSEKIHSLFNFEQSHIFGLRVLSVMISCLDTHLLLQSQYKYQDMLLVTQAENTINEKEPENIIIDMLSVERNHILVRSYLVGGPSERVLPPRHLNQAANAEASQTKDKKVSKFKKSVKDTVYPYPLFSSYPVPREYTPNLGGRTAMKQDNELVKFLTTKKPEKGKIWLDKCRVILTRTLNNKPEHVKGNVIQQLLDYGIPVMARMQEESIFPLLDYTGTDGALKSLHLSPLQQLGIKMAVRYGIHLKVIHTSSDATERLTQLIKQCTYFLHQQQRPVDTNIQSLQGSYPGFDWFAATIFLIFNGNVDRSWNFLHRFSTLGSSGYLWIPRLHSSVHLPTALMSSGIPPLFSCTGHYIEFILQIEVPLVASAFKMSGYTPAQICLHWLKQCFWNYLDWIDICHYVSICIILGVDYQVYMCVAIFKHLQKLIMEHMQTQDLIIFLKEQPVTGFQVSKYLSYMHELEKRYRKTVLSDMLNISKP